MAASRAAGAVDAGGGRGRAGVSRRPAGRRERVCERFPAAREDRLDHPANSAASRTGGSEDETAADEADRTFGTGRNAPAEARWIRSTEAEWPIRC